MPRPKSLTPKYRRHKPTGQAVVRIDGRDFYLGEHGSPESRERYAVLIADYLTVGRIPDPDPEPEKGASVDAVIAAYWQHIEANGRYTKNGKPTSERSWIRDSLKPLSDLFGETPAAEFGPKRMHALREWVIEASVKKGKHPVAGIWKLSLWCRRCSDDVRLILIQASSSLANQLPDARYRALTI